MKILLYLIFTVLAFAPPALAVESLPPEMLVDGKPIDPMCFGDGIGGEGVKPIPFKDCGKDTIVLEREISDDGLTQRATYKYKDETEEMRSSYNRYTYIGKDKNDIIITFTWNGGGTGHFDHLVRLKRTPDGFIAEEIVAAGDRCNGGFIKAQIDEKGALHYSQNVTPYDLFFLGSVPESTYLETVKPYDDLDSCAICCIARVGSIGEDVEFIDFSEYFENFLSHYNESGDKKEMKTCFNNTMIRNTEGGQTKFSLEEWKMVIREFEHICLGREEGK